jgi:hypothetical protein
MTLKGFLFLFMVTVATVMGAGALANMFIPTPGLERTLVVAVIACLVVFPASKYAEKRGWVKGNLDLRKKKPEAASEDKS